MHWRKQRRFSEVDLDLIPGIVGRPSITIAHAPGRE